MPHWCIGGRYVDDNTDDDGSGGSVYDIDADAGAGVDDGGRRGVDADCGASYSGCDADGGVDDSGGGSAGDNDDEEENDDDDDYYDNNSH